MEIGGSSASAVIDKWHSLPPNFSSNLPLCGSAQLSSHSADTVKTSWKPVFTSRRPVSNIEATLWVLSRANYLNSSNNPWMMYDV